MKRGKAKRLLSLAMALLMVLSVVPGNSLTLTVYAEVPLTAGTPYYLQKMDTKCHLLFFL